MRPKDEEDYHDLAAKHNLRWVGHELPRDVLTKTGWECDHGHLWQARYADLYMDRSCPQCKGMHEKGRKDYEALARWHGIYFVGPIPQNVRHKTWWEHPGPSSARFRDSYRNLLARRVKMYDPAKGTANVRKNDL